MLLNVTNNQVNGDTPLQLALKNNNSEVADLLKSWPSRTHCESSGSRKRFRRVLKASCSAPDLNKIADDENSNSRKRASNFGTWFRKDQNEERNSISLSDKIALVASRLLKEQIRLLKTNLPDDKVRIL